MASIGQFRETETERIHTAFVKTGFCNFTMLYMSKWAVGFDNNHDRIDALPCTQINDMVIDP